MTYQARIAAVRRVREEADKLRLACIKVAGTGALLHMVYDTQVNLQTPADQLALLSAIK